MRRFLIPLLMAGAMMPAAALAQDPDRETTREQRRVERRSERAESTSSTAVADNRQQGAQRAERQQRIERVVDQPRFERRERRAGQVQAIEPVRQIEPVEPRFERRERRANRVRVIEPVRQLEPEQQVQGQPVRVRRQDGILGGLRETAREQQVLESRPATRDGGRDGIRGGLYDRNLRWSNHWRTDRRYDWRRHRDRNRSIFRLGSYYDPYGWGYRRFSIGFNIGSSYYGSNYWLDDPWAYRLPPAYGPYRWVRYYDDALLVNLYSGQVVDVIHNFFW